MSRPRVIVTVLGGVVEVEKITEDIEVIVKDYDVENYASNDKRLRKDKYGKYIRRVFGN